MTLAGFRSRWTIPCWCAKATASTSGTASFSSSSSGQPILAGSSSASVFPSTSSIVRNWTPSASSTRVDRDDVRMIEGGDRPRLALEALQALRVGRHLRREQLQRHAALERRVLGGIDLAHAAGAELLQDPIVAKRRPITVDSCPTSVKPASRRAGVWRRRAQPGTPPAGPPSRQTALGTVNGARYSLVSILFASASFLTSSVFGSISRTRLTRAPVSA